MWTNERWQLIISFLCTLFAQNVFSEESDVVILTDTNFTSFEEDHQLFMFVFYVNWCTHCKEMMPIYELAAKILKRSENPVILAKIDGMTQNQLVERFQVKVYPTFFIRNRGRFIPFKDRPTTKTLVDAVLKEARPAYRPISNLKELQAERNVDQAVLLALTDSLTHSLMDLFDQSIRYADSDLKAFVSKDPDTRKHFNVTDREFAVFLLQAQRFSLGPSTIVDITEIYTKPGAQPKEVSDEVLKRQPPLVGAYNQLTLRMYNSVRDMVLCVIPQSFSISAEPVRAMNKIADQLKQHILPRIKDQIHWILVDDLNYPKVIESYSDSDFMVGCRLNNETFTMPGDKLDMNEIEVFARKTLLKISLQRKGK